MKTITEKEAWNKMSAYCSKSEHCKSDVTRKLKAWGASDDICCRIIERLEKENYLDEARYCRSFVRDKYLFNKWGKIKIAQALHFKQLPDTLINICIKSEIDREEYLGILKKLLESKDKSIKAETQYERNGKLIRFAMSRGFEMEDISVFINL